METRLYPVSATTSRLLCASQMRPLGYIAASEGPASVFTNDTPADFLVVAEPAAAAGMVSVAVATTRSAPTSDAVYALRIFVPLNPLQDGRTRWTPASSHTILTSCYVPGAREIRTS